MLLVLVYGRLKVMFNVSSESGTYLCSFIQSAQAVFQGCSERVQLVLPEKVSPLLGDRDALSRLFSNLLENAIKHGDEKGDVEVSMEQLDKTVMIHIHNFGPALPEQLKTSVFKNFWQGVPGRIYVAHTGFGLYVCHRIVSLHRGRLSCKSSDGETTMTIALPLASS